MSTSETARKGPETSADRTGDRYYADARAQFFGYQRTLEAIGEGAFVSRALRREFRAHLDAAIYSAAGSVVAKQAQIDAGEGRPLTFCFGSTKHRRLPELKNWPLDHLGLSEIVWGFSGDGCGGIFVDSTTDSRPVFAAYCPVCREKGHGRRAGEVIAGIARLFQGRFPAYGGWRVTCTCGERFFTTTPQRTRCDGCQH
jgi:hypothetical protein